MRFWRNLSIAKKLYFVVGIMAVLIAGELLTLRFAMHTLSAVRAFVGGEGVWSKAQKNALLKLQRYGATHNEKDYQAFLDALKIPEGDHRARAELQKPHPDPEIIRQGFLDGHIHPDDIPPIVELLRRFYWVSYLDRAVKVWGEGDKLLFQLKDAAAEYHRTFSAKSYAQIIDLNEQLTTLEEDFSAVLGEGSRWLEHVVISLLFLAVLTVESFGLTLTFRTSRMISRGLADLGDAANRIGQGDFGLRLPVRSRDEIGRLTEAVNGMGAALERSYTELETRVKERTAKLESLADENAKLYEQASDAVRMRDEFLSIAAHELRSPLTSLSLKLQILERNPSPEKTHELIGFCLRQSKRLSRLIEELMDLTRLRLGKLELQPERCDLAAITYDVVTQLGADAACNGSVITVHADNPVFGTFDPTRMSQIVTNLISNAIKYGNGNPIDVTVKSAGDQLCLVVRDHGLGIPPEQQQKIFDRFGRAVPEGEIEGLGLGLYVTRQIVEAHRGRISVQSQPGTGSEFTVELDSEPA
jgi:signal transduction histidine kinase